MFIYKFDGPLHLPFFGYGLILAISLIIYDLNNCYLFIPCSYAPSIPLNLAVVLEIEMFFSLVTLRRKLATSLTLLI